jgi:hypothetical protein
MAAVRHAWMFRTAAIVHLFFGLAWLWRFGFTDYRPDQRVYGLAAGVVAVILAVMLFRLRRYAIGVSAVAAAIVGLSAAVFAPNAKGPVILFLAALAIICVVYAVLAMRAVTRSGHGAD